MRSKFILILLFSSLIFGKTLVIVNGHKIDDSIFPVGYEKLDKKNKDKLIKQLIMEYLLYQELLKSDVIKTDKFKKIFDEEKIKFAKSYKKATGKDLKKAQIDSLKGSVALKLYKDKRYKEITISDDEAKKFYDKNRKKFKFLDAIEVADIIVPQKNQAKDIISKLKKSNNVEKDFIKIAKKYNQRGYMGWFQKGQAPQNLFDIVYSAKPRSLIATPIKTKHGYNVIYLINKKKAETVSFEKAKKSIKDFLKKKIVAKELNQKVNELYAKAKIEY